MVVAVASALVVKAGGGFSETLSLQSPASVARWDLDTSYYSCLSDQVKQVLRPGQSVWVSPATPGQPYWIATLRKVVAAYTPISSSPRGTTKLYLVRARHARACLGLRVRAVTRDGTVRYGRTSLVGSTAPSSLQ
jgi:hypothetical protein